MAKFLITIPHEEEEIAGARAVKLLLETGPWDSSPPSLGRLDACPVSEVQEEVSPDRIGAAKLMATNDPSRDRSHH